MFANALLQSITSGIITGCVYALVALSLVIVYKATDVANFGGGEIVMAGAYVALLLLVYFELSYAVVFVAVALVMFTVGAAFDFVALRQIARRVDPANALVSMVIATLGLAYVLRGTVRLFSYTEEVRRLPSLVRGPPLHLGPAIIQYQDIAIIMISVLLIAGLYVFFRFTLAGKALSATSQNAKAALLVGIPVRRMRLLVWGIASLLAGVAGILIGGKLPMSPDFGSQIILVSFAAAIIGGFTSLPGCVVGGVLLGVFQNIVGLLASSSAIAVTPFLAIMLVLVLRPQGLLGGRTAMKKV